MVFCYQSSESTSSPSVAIFQNIQSKSKVFYKLSHQIVVETLDSEYDTIHILYICDMSLNYPRWVTFGGIVLYYHIPFGLQVHYYFKLCV